ncbi:lipopolysaccharide biosynthesis protein [Lactobacillus crispatus]|uniref:lipopolysaccharide biosynthesis protein n=1 Tax=Lactobacillus crispatus TaxID=47770 RepID=UPI003F23A2B3
MASRTRLATKNVIATLATNVLIFPIQFINRYYMVRYLGIKYLGITSLFTNILSVLSLADLGIGTAIVFLLYKPLAEHNINKISVLMKFYRKIYRLIALVIFILGLVVMPFLHIFLHEEIDYPHVYILFIIYLLGTASSYLFSYNQSLLYADQKNNIYAWYNLIVSYVMIIIQVITVKIFANPLLYAGLFVFTNFVTNIFVNAYVNKLYRLNYKTEEKLTDSETVELKENVIGNVVMRVSGVVVNGTDSLLLSAFVNVIQVGLYANYLTITNVISRIMSQVLNAITGSIGNFIVNKGRTESEKLFFNLQFLNFILLNWAVLGIIFVSKDVITAWLGTKYVLSELNTILIGLSFFFMNYRMLGWNFIAVYGLSKYMKLFSVSEMLTNFVLSFIFLKFFKLGITGIVLGTICSTLLTVGWQDPWVIFHHAFNKPLKKYIIRYFFNIFILMVELFIITTIFYFIDIKILNVWIRLIIKIVSILLMGTFIPLLFYLKTEEEKYLLSLCQRLLNKGRSV